MKVGLYLRVSTQEQAKEGYSIGEQESRLRNYCKAMLWDIYKIYVDPGYSGGDTNRPGLQNLIDDVKSGIIGKVVVYKLDRLSRSQLDTLFLIEKIFLANGTDFVSMSENFDTSTPFGRAMIGILAVFAQLEREQIKERMNMGKEARAKEGKWHGGATQPIGYDYDPVTDELIVNDYEAMQIVELQKMFLRGIPLRTIEREFEHKGYKHKHGLWTAKTMRTVLRSKLYIGYIKHNDEWFPGLHKSILTVDKYDRVQKLLDERLERFNQLNIKAGAQTTYLGGLLYCKHCGGKYAKQENCRRKPGKELTFWYMCYSRSKKSKAMIKDPTCKNKNWKMKELDQIVFDEIKKLATDPDYIAKMVKQDDSNKIITINREIEKLDNQISRFMDLYGIGKFTIEQVSAKIDPLNEQKNSLQKELNALTNDTPTLSHDDSIKIASSFADILERGNFEEIRLTIEALIYYIEIDNEDIYIHWKFE